MEYPVDERVASVFLRARIRSARLLASLLSPPSSYSPLTHAVQDKDASDSLCGDDVACEIEFVGLSYREMFEEEGGKCFEA